MAAVGRREGLNFASLLRFWAVAARRNFACTAWPSQSQAGHFQNALEGGCRSQLYCFSQMRYELLDKRLFAIFPLAHSPIVTMQLAKSFVVEIRCSGHRLVVRGTRTPLDSKLLKSATEAVQEAFLGPRIRLQGRSTK